MGMITGTTKLLGVIGDPIEHSLSPVMHNAALAILQENIHQRGLSYVYLPFAVKSADLLTAIAGFAAIGLQGFNVTIPHKQAIVPLLSEVSAIAQAVGAVNTVWRTEQGWSGTNTDVIGFLAPLQACDRDWTQIIAVILGSGGAARAVVAGCAQLKCAAIRVVGRDIQKLQQFHQSWTHHDVLSGNKATTDSISPANLSVHTWDELPDLLPQASLLVNSTPIGMYPRVDQSPLSAIAMAKLPKNAIVYDLIYTPNPTLFLKQAQEQGLIAIDGLEMLVQQGAAALRIWLQKPVPVDVMRQAARHHLAA
jgi:shikimate dehydrogenase